MVSWKICTLLLVCLFVVLVSEAEAGRRRGGRGRNNAENSPDVSSTDEEGEEGNNGNAPRGNNRRGGGGGGGGRRRGGRRRGQGAAAVDESAVGETGTGNARGGRRGGGGGGGNGAAAGGPNRNGRRGGRRGGAGAGAGRPQRGGRRGQGRNQGAGAGRGVPTGAKLARIMAGFQTSLGTVSLNMYREMAERNSNNFVVCPLSVYTAMTMVLLGAAGPTKRELKTGLSLSAGAHHAIKAYSEDVSVLEEDTDPTLSMANNIYAKPNIALTPGFVRKLWNFYMSNVTTFAAENPEDAINEWVEEKTGGEIVDFLDDGAITADTVIYLVNAIYFKGAWKNKFDEMATSMQPFHVSSSEQYDVDMMQRTGDYKVQHSDALDASVLELPYEGDRFSLFIVLPDQDTDLVTVESRLSSQILESTLGAEVQSSRHIVSIPKFSLDTDQQMKEVLQSLGIQSLFSRQAKLRKMTRDRNVYVSEVQHRAVLEVDEEGTVAAAATGVNIVPVSLPPQFIANRPFMFVLRDKERSVNLFTGRYTNPQGDNIAM